MAQLDPRDTRAGPGALWECGLQRAGGFFFFLTAWDLGYGLSKEWPLCFYQQNFVSKGHETQESPGLEAAPTMGLCRGAQEQKVQESDREGR